MHARYTSSRMYRRLRTSLHQHAVVVRGPRRSLPGMAEDVSTKVYELFPVVPPGTPHGVRPRLWAR